jgi:hypothetical protein
MSSGAYSTSFSFGWSSFDSGNITLHRLNETETDKNGKEKINQNGWLQPIVAE